MSTAGEGVALVTVLRHGEVAGPANVLRGRTDDPLSESGWQQMQRACDTMRILPSAVIASPLARCRDFAQTFASRHALPFDTRDDLREIDFGAWENLTANEARALSPALFERFHTRPEGIVPPQGEPFDAFKQRVLSAFDAGVAQAVGTHLLMVTHAGVMRVLLSAILNLSWADAWRIALPPAGSFHLSCMTGHAPCLLNLNTTCAA